MDIEMMIDAVWISFGLAVVIVLFFVAVIFAVIKRKRDYHPGNGIPKIVDKPDRTEGSTDKDNGGLD